MVATGTSCEPSCVQDLLTLELGSLPALALWRGRACPEDVTLASRRDQTRLILSFDHCVVSLFVCQPQTCPLQVLRASQGDSTELRLPTSKKTALVKRLSHRKT